MKEITEEPQGLGPRLKNLKLTFSITGLLKLVIERKIIYRKI